MQEINNMAIQQEIAQNMSVVSSQSVQPSELYRNMPNNKEVWGHNRASRNSGNGQQRLPHEFNQSITSICENEVSNFHQNMKKASSTEEWLNNVNMRVNSATDSLYNRPCSENVDTALENFRNSKHVLKRRNSENIMTIEKNMRIARGDLQNSGHDLSRSSKNSISSGNLSTMNSGNRDEIDPYMRMSQSNDPHTAAIDLSNNCRQFYFNHLKKAEQIKQSVRTARHTRALDKVEGRQPTSLDNAMQKLRVEMADLMDQDLSLMSQLLKLNDKIEDIKAQASQRCRKDSFDSGSCYLGSSMDMYDSEMSDYEDSRIDLTKSVNSPYGYVSITQRLKQETEESVPEAEEIQCDPGSSEGDIVIHRQQKNKRKYRRHKSESETDEDTAKEDNDEDDDEDDGELSEAISTEEQSDAEEEENDDDEEGNGSHSDTDSTLSNKSALSDTVDDAEGAFIDEADPNAEETVEGDSGIQSPASNKEQPEVPAKRVKGGVSRNSIFLNFHKNNSSIRDAASFNPILNLQGHNINVEKYYVPQGLVYLKHTKSENVFCQFSH